MKKPLLIFGAAVGGLLALGPFWGLAGTILGMNRAFTVLSSDGVGSPQALSGAIGLSLQSVFFGLVACPIGVALAATCIVFLVRKDKQPRDAQVPPTFPAIPNS